MKKINGQEMLKIGELAKATGVTVSTIHYYVQEGLLTPPTKTSPNMAYYDSRSIQEIRFIQELQSRRYLPISVIRTILLARKEGQSPEHVGEMQSLVSEVFSPLDNEKAIRRLSLADFMAESGLAEKTVKELEAIGILAPEISEKKPVYNDIDLKIARLFQKFAKLGIQPSDLEVYRQYNAAVRAEVQAMHQLIHRLPDHEHLPLEDLLKTLNDLKGCLSR